MMLINRLFAQSNMEADQSTASLLREAAEALALAQPQQEPVYVQLRYKDDEGYWSPWGTPLDPSLRNKKWAPEFEMRLLYDEPPAREPMTHGDLDLCRQWFGCIQDTNPSYIGRNDCALAAKLYTRLGLPIPKELQGASAHGIKDTP